MHLPSTPPPGTDATRTRVTAKAEAQLTERVRRQMNLVAGLCRLIGTQYAHDPDRSGPQNGPNGQPRLGVAIEPPSAAPNGKPMEKFATATPPGEPSADHDDLNGLSPRLRQTLQRLLAGDAEKQIAVRLGLSQHTVHVYVKALYKHYGACSRGELLAHFVRPTDLDPG